MLRLLARYGPPVFMAVAPLLTNQYSLLDLLGYAPGQDGTLTLSFLGLVDLSGPKAEVEMQTRTAITLAGVFILVVGGFFDAYLPSRSLVAFRHDYLDSIVSEQWRRANRVRSDLRVNIMYLKWRWWMPFGRSFKVVWKDRFHPKDRDGHLRFYTWQGVCGKAARSRDVLFVDFRAAPVPVDGFASKYLLRNTFHLWPWQLRRTRHIKAILSVPMYDTRGPKGQEHKVCVGVINVDATTEADADYLAEKADHLGVFLTRHGQLIAKMR